MKLTIRDAPYDRASFSTATYNWDMSEKTTQNAKLTIVPTPIGNLGDMTIRAIRALESSDAIYAEDTRVAKKLISALDLKVNALIFRLDENMMSSHAEDVADMVASGKTVAYCSDAGMPGVSDPGLRLVSLLREKGIPVDVLPGASASITAYVASGSKSPCFYFGGFLPRKESQKEDVLEKLSGLEASLIFYESPNRLVSSLKAIAKMFPCREVSVCRELTKMHEEIVRGNTGEVAGQFEERERNGKIKGECAIVIDAMPDLESAQADRNALLEASRLAKKMAEDGESTKSAVRKMVELTGINKNKAYEIFLDAKSDSDE